MNTLTVSEWKCGDCGKLYATEELMKLKKQKAVEQDTNPKKQHGYVSVCECGYVFHKDKWQLKDNIEINLNWLQSLRGYVSTVFLELNHFGCWYETMIFLGDWKCHYQRRYVTKAEARDGHRQVLKMIENKQFEVNKEDKEIEFVEVEK